MLHHDPSKIANLASGVRVSDSQRGIRAFSRTALETLSFTRDGGFSRRWLLGRSRRHVRRDRELISTLTYRLEFGQMTSRRLALIAGMIFHPTFRFARLMIRGSR